MPTPHGSLGGITFGADELRVLRRALDVALHPAPLPSEDVRACLRLAASVDEAVREAGRLRAFLVADLARYRHALPGSVAGYLELLGDALDAGHVPLPDDLAALRALGGNATAAALLERCMRLRATGRRPPAPRTRLLALPGGRADADDAPRQPRPREPAKPQKPGKPAEPGKPGEPKKPAEPRKPGRPEAPPPGEPGEPSRPREPGKPGEPGKPSPPRPAAPSRPMPKPSEVFPPKRRPAPPRDRLADRCAGPARVAGRAGRAPAASLLWIPWTTYPRSCPPS
ncbi:hypothetical protein [Streptomyces sp. NPDC095613]|uniref:hypothetical protein n=1 Tax=Streptomyces sp. NPDC095613 TaxID=3155540 RepID=UPI003323316A